MSRKVRYGIMTLLLIVFCTAGSVIFFTYFKYEQEDKVYEQAAEEYTRRIVSQDDSAVPEEADNPDMPDMPWSLQSPPLEVDFDKLRELNGDVVGWLYCEGTVIDYPILQGEDNDYYLHRNLNRQSHKAGSIFVEATNQAGFEDSNTIIYGHHMKNGSMFATLDNWAEQDYYEEHPVMWLLTPEQDYLILLFAGYTTPALSDTYTVFAGPCDELEEYLEQCREKSDFAADFGTVEAKGQEELNRDDRYVVLSTCDYSFQDARYVLHGKLVPVGR